MTQSGTGSDRDYHLRLFRMSRPGAGDIVQIGIPDAEAFEGDEPILPGWDIPIARYFAYPGAAARYQYDFGDGREHMVTLEIDTLKHTH